MFQILDGREQFYQWDIDRKLIVLDDDITEVHFCNRTDDCSLVCEVKEINGVRVVDVPNVLLQDDLRINVYAYDKNYTKHSECFKVIRRTKPTDYVYTETEIKRYGDLEERIAALEENGIPSDVDLTGYATEDYVDNAISKIEPVDLTGYATEDYVNKAISNAEMGDGFSGLITPDMLDLRENWGATEAVAAAVSETETETDITSTIIFTDGIYYGNNYGKTPTEFTYREISLIEIPNLSAGDKVRFCISTERAMTQPGNYFIFTDDNNICVLQNSDIANYAAQDTENKKVYLATVPQGATKLYTATVGKSMVYAIKISGTSGGDSGGEDSGNNGETFNIGWLRLEDKNFTNEVYATIKAIVGNSTNTASFDSRLITHNPYGRIDFMNKSIVAYGDSITAGHGVGGSTGSYIGLLAKKYNATLTNRAVSGTYITGADSSSITYKITQNNDADKDIIIVAGGINDYSKNKPLGVWGDTTADTFYGSLYIACEHLAATAPDAKVIFITPFNHWGTGQATIGTDAFRRSITETALKYGFAVIDGRVLGLPTTNDTWGKELNNDGWHPTALGHKVICNALIGLLC